MTEFEFDKASADRIEKVVQNYPMSLKDCADVLEFIAPLCTIYTAEGFINRLKISFRGMFE